MLILNQEQIKRKNKRLAFQILENNFGEKSLKFIGINNNGLNFAKEIGRYAKLNSDLDISYHNIRLNASDPAAEDVQMDIDPQALQDQCVILFDDVANTGRTLFYALKPLLEVLPKKVEIAVLVDRKHKNFPVTPKYVGLSLATTLADNIKVQLRDVDEKSVYLL